MVTLMTATDHAATRSADAELAAELRSSVMGLARRLRREGSDGLVTQGQYAVLVDLKAGPLTPRQLADLQVVRPPSVTRMLATLVELGLVERTEHPDDGRQVLISLSRAGRAHIRTTQARRAEWLDRQLGRLTPRDRKTLARAAQVMSDLASA